jgi:hypothetical protein
VRAKEAQGIANHRTNRQFQLARHHLYQSHHHLRPTKSAGSLALFIFGGGGGGGMLDLVPGVPIASPTPRRQVSVCVCTCLCTALLCGARVSVTRYESIALVRRFGISLMPSAVSYYQHSTCIIML